MSFEYDTAELAEALPLDTARGSSKFHLPGQREQNAFVAEARAAGRDADGHWVQGDPLNVGTGCRLGPFHRAHVSEETKRVVLAVGDAEDLELDGLDHAQRVNLHRMLYERIRGSRDYGSMSQKEMFQYCWIREFDGPTTSEWPGF